MVDTSKGINDIPEWFRGCQLNYAENLLNKECHNTDKMALIALGNYNNDR